MRLYGKGGRGNSHRSWCWTTYSMEQMGKGRKRYPAGSGLSLEGQLLTSVNLKPFSWFKFIDDMDMKWTRGLENLKIFIQEANSFHSTKRFTAEDSSEEHVFLDTKSRPVVTRLV